MMFWRSCALSAAFRKEPSAAKPLSRTAYTSHGRAALRAEALALCHPVTTLPAIHIGLLSLSAIRLFGAQPHLRDGIQPSGVSCVSMLRSFPTNLKMGVKMLIDHVCIHYIG